MVGLNKDVLNGLRHERDLTPFSNVNKNLSLDFLEGPRISFFYVQFSPRLRTNHTVMEK